MITNRFRSGQMDSNRSMYPWFRRLKWNIGTLLFLRPSSNILISSCIRLGRFSNTTPLIRLALSQPMRWQDSRTNMKTNLSIQFLSNLVSASDRRISKTFILLTLSYTELIHSILKSVRRWIRTQIMNKECLWLISMNHFAGKLVIWLAKDA